MLHLGAQVELTAPVPLLRHGYGAPTAVFLTISAPQQAEELVRIEVAWVGKQPTRLYESLYFNIQPLLSVLPDGSDSEWQLLVDKLGSEVDTADVVTRGGSAVHG
eukprot:COSAG05_NODE_7151_length_849_cov_1.249333_1_plen_104_part_10